MKSDKLSADNEISSLKASISVKIDQIKKQEFLIGKLRLSNTAKAIVNAPLSRILLFSAIALFVGLAIGLVLTPNAANADLLPEDAACEATDTFDTLDIEVTEEVVEDIDSVFWSERQNDEDKSSEKQAERQQTTDEKGKVAKYRADAEQGYVQAQYELAGMYYYGKGVKKDQSEAAKWYRKAAEQGNAKAQNHLGDMYLFGYGVNKSATEAQKWHRKAAEQGNVEAQLSMASLYYSENHAEAAKWYKKAAEKGSISALVYLGQMYDSDGNYAEAVKWYKKAAEKGSITAQKNLGMWYYYGRNGIKKDYAEAAKWFRKAAEQGDEAAISKLKNMGYDI